MGTFGYVAPEHASFDTLNERSDACSFGIPLVGVISEGNPMDDTSSRDNHGASGKPRVM